jgi:hypothetical protein
MFKRRFSARMALLGFLGIALFVPQEITRATEFGATGTVPSLAGLVVTSPAVESGKALLSALSQDLLLA